MPPAGLPNKGLRINLYNTVYSRATDWCSEQLLSTERSHDLIKAISYSTKFDKINNDTDTHETDWPGHYLFRPGRSPGLQGNCA